MKYCDYLINTEELFTILARAETDLLSGNKSKFLTTKIWRDKEVPDFPGVYALFENDKLIYVGETGNLRERMSDICRTVNHTFRKQLGHKKFGAIKTRKKFEPEIELLLDTFFQEKLYVNFIKVNFGRVEIEEYLVTKYQKNLLNSEKKRKLKFTLDDIGKYEI